MLRVKQCARRRPSLWARARVGRSPRAISAGKSFDPRHFRRLSRTSTAGDQQARRHPRALCSLLQHAGPPARAPRPPSRPPRPQSDLSSGRTCRPNCPTSEASCYRSRWCKHDCQPRRRCSTRGPTKALEPRSNGSPKPTSCSSCSIRQFTRPAGGRRMQHSSNKREHGSGRSGRTMCTRCEEGRRPTMDRDNSSATL